MVMTGDPAEQCYCADIVQRVKPEVHEERCHLMRSIAALEAEVERLRKAAAWSLPYLGQHQLADGRTADAVLRDALKEAGGE